MKNSLKLLDIFWYGRRNPRQTIDPIARAALMPACAAPFSANTVRMKMKRIFLRRSKRGRVVCVNVCPALGCALMCSYSHLKQSKKKKVKPTAVILANTLLNDAKKRVVTRFAIVLLRFFFLSRSRDHCANSKGGGREGEERSNRRS